MSLTVTAGFAVVLASGEFLHYPDARPEDADSTVQWFRDAQDGQVITLSADNGPVRHVQKRHIVRIEVAR